MKKILFFTALFFAVLVSAQEEDFNKLSSLLTVLKEKQDINTVDSVLIELQTLENSTNQAVKLSLPEVKSMIKSIKEDNALKVYSKEVTELSKDDLKQFKVTSDKFRNITFYTPKVFGTSKYAYLSVKENSMKLRLVMQHHGAGWIFFNKVIILFNGKKIEYNAGETTRYVGNGYVTETSDVFCNEEMLEALREIIKTDKVEVRLSGDKVNDFEMSDKTKKSIRLTLELYDKLKK